MNKLFTIIIALAVVGTVSAFALSPYFTESTIDDAIPTGAIIQLDMKDEMMKDDTMEKEMMKDDTVEKEMMKDDTVEKEMMKDDTMEKEMTMPMSFTGTFIGVGDGIHDAQGDAYTIPLEDGSDVLRLENFISTNGPDLYVYLSTDDNASEFINLGELKASKGNQNYEIPNDTDLNEYDKVLIWCKAFGVLFGSAELSSQ